MKPLFVIFEVVLCAVLVFGHGDDAKFTEIRNVCNETFPTTYEYDQQLMTVGSFPDESDKTPKCWIHCVMEKTGMINEEGAFVESSLVEILKDYPNGTEILDFDKLVNKCATINAQEDNCERAYGFAKCLMTEEIQRQKEA